MAGGYRHIAIVWAALGLVQCTGAHDDDDDDDDATSEASTDDDPDSDDGMAMLQMCGIDDIVLSAPGMVDKGMGPGQIPPDIGDTIERNCGCHFGDVVIESAIANPYPLATLADWQPNAAYILGRVSLDVGLTMPPAFPCHVMTPSGDTNITDEDQARLVAWLQAGAPDGASWMPPPPPPPN